MTFERRVRTAFAASWIVVPALAAALGSRLYWGHWGRPPSADQTLESISTVRRFSSLWHDQSHSGVDALENAAARVNWIPGESPLERLPAALLERGLVPASDDVAPASLLDEIRTALAAGGLLQVGAPGYPRATDLRGHVAEAVGVHGQSLVVVALVGGEVSNDHHPYYEARFRREPDGLVLESFRHYWYDVAGIEGFAHVVFGALALLGTAAFWIIFGVVLLAAKLLRHIARRRKA